MHDHSVPISPDKGSMDTHERAISSVPYPANYIPSDEAVFDTSGKPCLSFLKNHFINEGRLSEKQILRIIQGGTRVLESEPNLLYLDEPVTICGDIHGQFYDLLKLIQLGGNALSARYLFMGDYVDRGYFSIECVLYLWAHKMCFPDSFWLLRGNHECRHLTKYFTFYDECKHKYSHTVYNACMTAFDTLPLAAVVNERFFCVHGGLSPRLQTLRDIELLDRFREPPQGGLMTDILWADPHVDFGNETDSNAEYLFNEARGCSYSFTYRAATMFLQRTKLLSIIRAHEAQDAGYRTYRKSESSGFPALMTIFSAPNYADVYSNRGAILIYGKNDLTIRQFNGTPHPFRLPGFTNMFEWSLPFLCEKTREFLKSVLAICAQEEAEMSSSSVI